MKDDYYLLNHLDEPVRFLFFTFSEFIVLLIPFMFGLFMDRMMFGLITGIVLYQLLRLIGKSFGGATLRQIAYWFLPTAKNMMQLNIPTCIRELQG